MSFVCQSDVIRMSLVCNRMSFVCHPYALVYYLYALVCHPYVTCMYSYIIRISLVYIRMSSVCHSYALVCDPYATCVYSYVICMPVVCMSVVCGFTMNPSFSTSEEKRGNSEKFLKSYMISSNLTIESTHLKKYCHIRKDLQINVLRFINNVYKYFQYSELLGTKQNILY